MNQLSPIDIANHLAQARINRAAWDPGETAALSLDEVYTVHNLVTDQLGLKIGAWKTSPLADPTYAFAGQIYEKDIFASGAKILASELFIIGVEGEIAFRFNRDFPATKGLYTRSDIMAGISAMLPLIEVVDSRMVDGMNQDTSLKMADNQSNAGIIIGAPVTEEWQDIDLTRLAVTLHMNGTKVYGDVSNNSIEDVFLLMANMINVAATLGTPVQSGHIITTGSCSGLLFVEPGCNLKLEISGVGMVEVSFSI